MHNDRPISALRTWVALGVIASLVIAAVSVATRRPTGRACVDTGRVTSAPPSPAIASEASVSTSLLATDHHELPPAQIVIRAVMAALVVVPALVLLVAVLASAHWRFNVFQVSLVTLASAALTFSPGVLKRFEHDRFFLLFFVAGCLPLGAAALVSAQDDSLNAAIVTVTIVAVFLALGTAALETKLGKWVWLWEESAWEWTLLPTLTKRRGSSLDASGRRTAHPSA